MIFPRDFSVMGEKYIAEFLVTLVAEKQRFSQCFVTFSPQTPILVIFSR